MASKPTLENGSRIIQSTFGSGIQKNFETVVLEKDGSNQALVHYWRDNGDPKQPWIRGDVISHRATSAASLIQVGDSDLELLVLEGDRVVHYTRNVKGWHKEETLDTERVTGAPSLIQSTYVGKKETSTTGDEGPPGDYEAVILEGKNLVHYTRNNNTKNRRWERKAVISMNASGPGAIIQSTIEHHGNQGNLEVVVPEGKSLRHYFYDGRGSWQKAEEIASSVAGNSTGSLLQSTFTDKRGAQGNFELLVYMRENADDPASGQLSHWWRDNGVPSLPWKQTVVISNQAAGPGSIMQSTYGDVGYPGDLEAVFVEHPNNLVHYWRGTSGSWNRGAVISNRAVA